MTDHVTPEEARRLIPVLIKAGDYDAQEAAQALDSLASQVEQMRAVVEEARRFDWDKTMVALLAALDSKASEK